MVHILETKKKEKKEKKKIVDNFFKHEKIFSSVFSPSFVHKNFFIM